MPLGTVSTANRSQVVLLPWDARLPDDVQKVEISINGNERVIAPVGQSRDGFFIGGPSIS